MKNGLLKRVLYSIPTAIITLASLKELLPSPIVVPGVERLTDLIYLAYVGVFAFPVWVAYQVGAWHSKRRLMTPTAKSAQEGAPSTESKSAVLKPWRQRQIMELGFQSLVKQDLLAIERQFDFRTPKHVDFDSWNDIDADLKKQYIDNPTVYSILENIAKVLNEWNAELDRAALLMLEPNSVIWVYVQSYKKYCEKLRELEFLN
jgi:hypothetical protein